MNDAPKSLDPKSPENIESTVAAFRCKLTGAPYQVWGTITNSWFDCGGSSELSPLCIYRPKPESAWSLDVAKHFRPLVEGEKFHREADFSRNLLLGGKRPLLENEVCFEDVDECSNSDGERWEAVKGLSGCKAGHLQSYLIRTSRPLPSPKTRAWNRPSDVPGPVCWIRSLNRGNEVSAEMLIFCVYRDSVAIYSGGYSLARGWEHSTDRLNWYPCEVTE